MAGSGSPDNETRAESSELSLAEKIGFLFRTVHPAGRGPYSLQEAADGITGLTGEKVSHNTLWRLRTGKNNNPTKRVLEGLAAFFEVNPAYFFDDEASKVIENQVELLAMLRDTGVRGAQMRAFFDLSPGAQSMISDLIEATARLERQRRQQPDNPMAAE
ncbi:helix-turn-helix domain-containing protein [Actinomadura meridiana]|uniref:Helix-turn-helix domain-containing protein n=1 Tax=Actinomadura meridiana TaxID=559626 RepID=A0ABP8BVJ3_9ACTN